MKSPRIYYEGLVAYCELTRFCAIVLRVFLDHQSVFRSICTKN